MTDKPSQHLGKYEILEEIGRGANAVVYKARHTTLERVDALKVMRPGLLWEEEAIQRFLREARAAASLDHPNIVPIYDVGEEQGTYYIAMKYLPGRTVDQLIQDRGPLPVDEALNIALQVADALAYAHQRGFVHRDIKPGNIIVDERGHATLTDFGLAKALEWASMTSATGVVGTPAYIPPEVWEGKKATPASDVYSLGCVLWEMLAGRTLFEGDTPAAVMRGHLMEPPPPLEEVRPEVPKETAQAVRRALAKVPEERYADARAFAAALQQAVELKEPDYWDVKASLDKAGREKRWAEFRSKAAELSIMASNLDQEYGPSEEVLQRTRAFLDELKALYRNVRDRLSPQAKGRITGRIRAAEILAGKVEYYIQDLRQEQTKLREQLKRLKGRGYLANPDMVFIAADQLADKVKKLNQEIQKLATDLEDAVEQAYSNSKRKGDKPEKDT